MPLQIDYLQDARLMKVSFWKFKTFLVDKGVALDDTNKTSTKFGLVGLAEKYSVDLEPMLVDVNINAPASPVKTASPAAGRKAGGARSATKGRGKSPWPPQRASP